MHKIWFIFTLILTLSRSTDVNIDSDNSDIDIEDLEKKKNELLDTINVAIDDTVQNLNATNDTDALITADHLVKLKKQLIVLNNTDDHGTKLDEIFEDQLRESDLYNASIDRRNAIASSRNQHIKLNLTEIVNLLKKKGDFFKTLQQKELDENRIKIQEQLRLWMLQKQKEKEMIKKYKASRLGKTEMCPNQGVGKMKKKSKGFRRSRDSNKKKKKDVPVYPCCRKCCKRSDMGCLK